MATREENLKKINAELEKLSDEELEIVAGGSKAQTDELKALFNQAKSLGRKGFNNLDEFLTYAGIKSNVNNTVDRYEPTTHLAENYRKISAKNNEYVLSSTGLKRSHQEAVAMLKEFYGLE